MGNVGGGLKEGNCCQEQMLNFLPVLFPQIRVAERSLADRRMGRGR